MIHEKGENIMKHFKNFETTQAQDIDIKEILSVVKYYFKSIILITLFVTIIASIFAYYSTNVYQSQALIKIPAEKYTGSLSDFMTVALGQEGSNIEDELIVLGTNNIAYKALNNLHIGTRYYVHSLFKKRELYKDTPFLVTSHRLALELQNQKFDLYPIDEKSFRLCLNQSFSHKANRYFSSLFGENNHALTYDKVHTYGEEIVTDKFRFRIEGLQEIKHRHYSFSITPNSNMSGFIRSRLSAKGHVKQGNVISLNFRDGVALRAKEILDAITQTYIEETTLIKSEGLRKKIHHISLQLDAIKEMLKSSGETLRNYKTKNTITNLSAKTNEMLTKLTNLEGDYYEIGMQIDSYKSMLEFLDKNSDVSGISLTTGGNKNSDRNSWAVQQLINSIQEASANLRSVEVNYKLTHPKVEMARVRLESLKKSFKEIITSSVSALEKRQVSINGVISKYKKSLEYIPEKEQELESLKRNFMINEKIYSYLLQKKAETIISESSLVSGTRIIENASLPHSHIKPKRQRIVLIGFIIGLIVAFFITFVRNFLDDIIKYATDIDKLTNIPLYGTITPLSPKTQLYYNESIRSLWTNLEFFKERDKSKLITFTSSVSGEGKTETISQLGEIIAQSSKSVILLDMDMRRPALHSRYKLSNNVGVSTLLAGKHTIDDVIQETSYDTLKVITSGPKPPNPTGLILANSLEPILTNLLRKYDYVLLDSPPIGLVSDAMRLMHLSDISLIVLRAKYSKKDFVKNINRIIQDDRINPGIVLNDVALPKNYGYEYMSN